MKTLLLNLLAFAAGFAISRLIPRDSTAGSSVSAALSAANPTPVTVAATLPAPSSPGTRDWKDSARAWAEADPEEFYHWMIKRGIPPDGDAMITLFTTWVKRDRDAAFTAAFNLPKDFRESIKSLPGILDSMLETALLQAGGPAAIWKWMPAAEEQMHSLTHPAKDWISTAPPEVLAALLGENAGGGMYTGVMLGQFAETWAARDPAAASAWVKTLPPGPARDAAWVGFMKDWTGRDSTAALDYLAHEASSGARARSAEPLSLLAQTNPRAALDWWEKNLGVGDYLFGQMLSSWCALDPAAAGAYARGVEDPALRRVSLEIWGWQSPPQEVLKAASEVTDPAEKSILIQALAGSYQQSSESAAFLRNFVEKGGGDVTPEIARTVGREYASTDPAAAFAWARALSADLQSEALGSVLWGWRDKAAAAQAVEQLPEGELKASAQNEMRTISQQKRR